MTSKELEGFRHTLEVRRKELADALGRREEIVIETSPEEQETSRVAADCEISILNLDRNYRNLKQIELALDRMKEGAFGICLRCEEAISPKRLGAIPWATYCVACQEIEDAEAAGRREEFFQQSTEAEDIWPPAKQKAA